MLWLSDDEFATCRSPINLWNERIVLAFIFIYMLLLFLFLYFSFRSLFWVEGVSYVIPVHLLCRFNLHLSSYDRCHKLPHSSIRSPAGRWYWFKNISLCLTVRNWSSVFKKQYNNFLWLFYYFLIRFISIKYLR